MGLDARKFGPVRSVPSLAAREQARQQEIAALAARIDECEHHQALVSSELWQKVVEFLTKREGLALSQLAHEDDDKRFFRLQGEIRAYRFLMQQEPDLRNAVAVYKARIAALKEQKV